MLPYAAVRTLLVVALALASSTALAGNPPVPPGGYQVPADLKIAPPVGVDLSKRSKEWVTVAAVAADKRKMTDLYASLNALAGGAVHIVFRNGAGMKVLLEGCATTGLVVTRPDGARAIYPFDQVEWVRAPSLP